MTDRGHVPYALLGVLLLVASASLSASLQPAVVDRPDVDRELERLTDETQTTLREASLTAARNAASEPVLEPSNTSAGAALREESAFEDALRLRIYRQVQTGLEQLDANRQGLAIDASLPPVGTTEVLDDARDRVHVTRAGVNGAKLEVTVENITLRATRGDLTVANRTVSPTVVVATPVLVVHERVAQFERELDAGVLDGGLGRALAARLYPVAWARGWAQYDGAPIQSVVANRHVSLATNDAVLSYQQAFFGASDPVGERAHATATADTAVVDLLAGLDRAELDFLEAARDEGALRRKPGDTLARYEPAGSQPSPHDQRRVSLADLATTELVDFLRGEDGIRRHDSAPAEGGLPKQHVSHLAETFGATYSEDVRIASTVDPRRKEVLDRAGKPAGSWSETGTERTRRVSVSDRETERSPVPDGWNRHEFYARLVTVTETTTKRWQHPDGKRKTTSRTVETTYAVDLSVLGQHANGPAPGWNVTSAYEAAGSPVGGPNLSDIPPAARDLVADRGGPDTLAAKAVNGTLDTTVVRLSGEYPDTLEAWVFEDLNSLRLELSAIGYETTRGAIATFRTNPPARLADRLAEQRESLVDVPEQYGSVAHRASVAAQVAYLDRVSMRLSLRAEERSETKANLDDHMDDPPDGQFDRLQRGLDGSTIVADGPQVGMRVDARPSYLTREPIDEDIVPAVPTNHTEHPLVVRNRNLIAAPYGDVADSILGKIRGIFSTDRTSLHAAADTLSAVERVAAETDATDNSDTPRSTNPGPGARADAVFRYAYRRLEASVDTGTDAVTGEVADLLGEYGLGDEASRTDAVDAALSGWETTSERALQLTEGGGQAAILEEVHDRWSLTETERDRLELELGWIIDKARARTDARPAVSRVESADTQAREALGNATRRVLEGGSGRIAEKTYTESGRVLSHFPKGVPVAPPPLPWKTTVNFWHVEVGGEYPVFQVRAPHGSGDRPGGDLVYVRDGSSVRVDLTGDGTPERLGLAPRLSFETSADIAVAVPPGPRGVGDVDGRREEESPGWPEPGPTE
ncbi:MAG: hypothetical protein V5A55_04490 [Halovenus sp.]